VLILVRHGQTEANAQGLLLGRADPPLTETGRRQARSLATALPTAARIVSSPLMRARQTAEVIARGSSGAAGGSDEGANEGAANPAREIEVDPRWIEMDYGSLDCRPASALDAASWRRWREDPRFVPADGESLASVGRRVREACQALAAEAAHRDVIVVSHVSPIKAAVAWAMGVGDEVAWRMFLSDAAVSRIDTSGGTPVLLAFNDACAAAHLPPAPAPPAGTHPTPAPLVSAHSDPVHPQGPVRARLPDQDPPDPETEAHTESGARERTPRTP
jgi:broad specificity phosphatase PhoE